MSDTNLYDLIERGLESSQAPAIAAALFTGETVLEQYVVGKRRQNRKEPVTADDLFHLGSNVKAMIATMAARLVQKGDFSFEQPLKELFEDEVLHPGFASVTFEQLLQHSAGLYPFTDPEEAVFRELADLDMPPIQARRELTRRLLTRAPSYPPGTEQNYSNAGYAVAASLLETRLGTSWKALLDRYVFDPLCIRGVVGLPSEYNSEQPQGHEEVQGSLQPDSEPELVPLAFSPAGDLSMTLGNYTTFLQSHLLALKGQSQTLSKAMARKLHGLDGEEPMGWGKAALDLTPVSAHLGSAGSFFALTALCTERDIGVTLLTNACTEEIEEVCSDVSREVLTSFISG